MCVVWKGASIDIHFSQIAHGIAILASQHAGVKRV